MISLKNPKLFELFPPLILSKLKLPTRSLKLLGCTIKSRSLKNNLDFYIGLKNYYKVNVKKDVHLSVNAHKRTKLAMYEQNLFLKEKNKLVNGLFIYPMQDNYTFVKRRFILNLHFKKKSRGRFKYLLNRKKKNKEAILVRFTRLMRRINRNNLFSKLEHVRVTNGFQKLLPSLSFFFIKHGNYDSGVSYNFLGITGFFLKFWDKPFRYKRFIPKHLFKQIKYPLLKRNYFYMIKNVDYITEYFVDNFKWLLQLKKKKQKFFLSFSSILKNVLFSFIKDVRKLKKHLRCILFFYRFVYTKPKKSSKIFRKYSIFFRVFFNVLIKQKLRIFLKLFTRFFNTFSNTNIQLFSNNSLQQYLYNLKLINLHVSLPLIANLRISSLKFQHFITGYVTNSRFMRHRHNFFYRRRIKPYYKHLIHFTSIIKKLIKKSLYLQRRKVLSFLKLRRKTTTFSFYFPMSSLSAQTINISQIDKEKISLNILSKTNMSGIGQNYCKIKNKYNLFLNYINRITLRRLRSNKTLNRRIYFLNEVQKNLQAVDYTLKNTYRKKINKNKNNFKSKQIILKKFQNIIKLKIEKRTKIQLLPYNSSMFFHFPLNKLKRTENEKTLIKKRTKKNNNKNVLNYSKKIKKKSTLCVEMNQFRQQSKKKLLKNKIK